VTAELGPSEGTEDVRDWQRHPHQPPDQPLLAYHQLPILVHSIVLHQLVDKKSTDGNHEAEHDALDELEVANDNEEAEEVVVRFHMLINYLGAVVGIGCEH